MIRGLTSAGAAGASTTGCVTVPVSITAEEAAVVSGGAVVSGAVSCTCTAAETAQDAAPIETDSSSGIRYRPPSMTLPVAQSNAIRLNCVFILDSSFFSMHILLNVYAESGENRPPDLTGEMPAFRYYYNGLLKNRFSASFFRIVISENPPESGLSTICGAQSTDLCNSPMIVSFA